MKTYKAISLRQPWANLIRNGQKTIETRSWPTKYRGEVLIISSKKPAIEPAGQALALAEIIDCRPMTKDDERGACYEVFDNAWAWPLANIRPIKPFPVTGRLGIYSVEVTDNQIIEQ